MAARRLMTLLRNLLFAIVFFGLSVPMVAFAPVVALFGSRVLRTYSMRWARLLRWSASWAIGVRVRIEGNIPEGPILFAAKHEALFEAVDLTQTLGTPATVMKRELAQIPLWGWVARRYGVIVVDREANAAALRSMMKEARAALAEGRSVLIFPEGTRVMPGEQPKLRAGFAGLYRILELPVVPVAVDSGRAWPRSGPKRPGVITYRFGDIISPGLPRKEIEARVHAGINALNP